MSEPYLELVLDELGLMPLWTRPELLHAAAPQAAIGAAPGAAEAVIASTRMAPSTEMAPAAAAPARPARPATVIPSANAPAAAPQPLAQHLGTVSATARAQHIASLDWAALQAEAASCTACTLCKSRNKVVFGVGQPQADWLVVGEAPGAEEDRLGEPFVGQAGKLLDAMLAAVGRARQDNVYILNTLKCRPPQNRNPQPDEMAQCAPFLQRQIELIRPKVIFAVGRFAVQALLGRDASIASLRGQLHTYAGIPVVVSYHPAYLLRNLPEKRKAWQDLLLAQRQLQAGPPA